MKEIDGKYFGECILCRVFGQGEKDFICANCGAPDKLMLVCKCGKRFDLTELFGSGLSEYVGAVISWNKKDEEDLNLGMTISVSKCFLCCGEDALKKEAGKDLHMYNVRNQGFNV